ncbi:MAG: hypothetical protein V7K40_19050 [Nostoc sp.]|uniref:hypothetical protein n=1 Tax=Nostoc sp. TaxID=1180 RepID=UPI002FF6B682
MQLLKQLGKQLGLAILMGSSIFSLSSVSAQAVESQVLVNVDVIYGVNYLKCLLSCTSTQKADVVTIGGRLNLSSSPYISRIIFGRNLLVDPFSINFFNDRNVGGSKPEFTDSLNSSNPFLEVTFNEKPATTEPPNNRLTLDFDYVGSNPPAFPYNNTTCKDGNGCVLFHYGYSEEITSTGPLIPSFFQTLIQLRDGNTLAKDIRPMATPIVTNSQGGVTQYLIIYHEQTDPLENGVVIGVWTEFPVGSGASGDEIPLQKKLKDIVQIQPQSQTLSYSNKNPGSIKISNTRVLLSATQIPLDQLQRKDLPPTDPRFIPLPSADGIIAPGQTTTPVTIQPPQPSKKAMTWIINTSVNVNGKTYVQARYDSQTNPYSGDTSISEVRSLLCIRKSQELASNPIPNIATGTAYTNSWSGGEVFAIPEVVGSSLLSPADADGKCQAAGKNRYGLSGFRMAEFHDANEPYSGFGFYAQSDDPNLSNPGTRFWVRINDQDANPWKL